MRPPTTPVPRARRHTLHFLHHARGAAPVHLDAEVDATELLRHRAAAARPVSVVTHVVHAVGRVLARHPDANAAYGGGGLRPRLVRYPWVDVKLTLDRVVDGTRVVLSSVLTDADRASRSFLQARITRLATTDPEHLPEFDGVRALRRLPYPVGRFAFAAANRATRRHHHLGTVAVTSLGHRRVQRFFSHGGTAVTVGVGRITTRPVVRDGELAAAPVLPLSLTFDHRVLDGAEAADVLDDLVETLCQPPTPEPDDAAR
ncbi:2-oxo acid dehydrogenase subunit E2 [Streptomyces alkaliterrae]|uniref:2-oxo acid dehydrogenase subunit E2 n=1 Tax=Streptomyces alkaliterrae TaxID=2213162 RepID=A0A5P0YW97_9ACTN|nr:2-oxo acid dehydrogenase subunit E2 [Streptomyces alkaliterrae]MBB1256109.1 2-oxo acid dehydrogenase subunit E2 [Streptomyces alkaliterrae]MBB1259115.1 2-oxo acid dehydrogenase subunit E2 [Streptomyces alkaliterrae]MQS03877.1 acyltransferase [Streptomyces alkaliterrae]